MSAKHTPGPWYWHCDSQERASLRTPDRGNLIVMQFVRQGMQGAQPRFSHWRGMEEGEERGRSGGIMTVGLNHPDARLIAAAPDMYEALKACRLELWRLLDVKGVAPQDARKWPEIVAAEAAIAKAEGR